MAPSEELSSADLQRLARAEAPDLAEAVIAFLVQHDSYHIGQIAYLNKMLCEKN